MSAALRGAAAAADRGRVRVAEARQRMGKRMGGAAAGAGPSSLFVLSETNVIRRTTRFLIEWPYPFYDMLHNTTLSTAGWGDN